MPGREAHAPAQYTNKKSNNVTIMKKIYLAIASLAALSFASCANDDAIEGAQNVASENTLCITASLGDAGSRLAIDDDLQKQTWSEGDYLVDNNGNEYKMKNGAGGVEANFEGPAPTEDCTLKFTVKNVNKTENPKQANIDDKAHLDGCLAVFSNAVDVKKDQNTLTPSSGLKFYNDLSIADVTIQLPEKYFGGEARAKYVDKVTLRLGRALDDYVLEYGDEAKLVGDENAGNDATLTLKAYIPVLVDPTVGITLIDDDITCTVAFKPETEGADPVKFEVKALGVNKVYHQGYTYVFNFSEFDVWALAANGSMFEDYLTYGKSVKNIKLMSDCTVSDKQITLPAVNIDLNGQELKTSKGFQVSEGGSASAPEYVNIFSSAKNDKGETVKGKVTFVRPSKKGDHVNVFDISANYVNFTLENVVMTETNVGEYGGCRSFVLGNGSNNKINIKSCDITGVGCARSYKDAAVHKTGLLMQNDGSITSRKSGNEWLIENSTVNCTASYSGTGDLSTPIFDCYAVYMSSYHGENNEIQINGSNVTGRNPVKVMNTDTFVNNSELISTYVKSTLTSSAIYGYGLNIDAGPDAYCTGIIEISGDKTVIKNNNKNIGVGVACTKGALNKPTVNNSVSTVKVDWASV